MKEEKNIEISNEENFVLALKRLVQDKFITLVLYGMILSYFYNLPVLKYSIKGDNEFRLYDILGGLLIYFYFKNYNIVNLVIRNVAVFKWLRLYIYWASITILFSLVAFVLHDAVLGFLQVVLYMYHFIIFYLTGIFFYIFCLDKNIQKRGIYLVLFFSIVSNLIVILQNIGVIEFLWSNVYRKAYGGFLSGTLGTNKIVLGMTSFFSFVLGMAIFLNKKIKINKILLYTSILLNLYIIILSGSRTTYVALGIFLVYFALKSPFRFVLVLTVFTALGSSVLSFYPELKENLEKTFEKRVTGKLNKNKELQENDVGDLYQDLGSGRDRLTIGNAIYLLENPHIWPFGAGFMNRFDTAPGQSAHNMYLQVIKETGLVGFVLYFGWLIMYLFIKFDDLKEFSWVLKGLIWAMLVTLFFGEHLYIYRPLFGLLGLFLLVSSILISGLHKIE